MENNSDPIKILSASPQEEIRKTVVMPDGKTHVPLGSGVVTALLGKGGMASVYEIWNSQLEVYHAVKLINPNCSKDALERFQTEIKITAKLHHPNISEIYTVGKWNDLPYIEMEKIEGTTLDRLIDERGALPIPVCTAIGIMIGRALEYAHNQEYVIYSTTYHGIIHRDLKPGNIMVCDNGIVKLMDFGIARPTEVSFHTMEGSVVGTLQYLSPEQLNGEALDIRTDIYSLGTTIYETITGVAAFPEQNIHKLVVEKTNNRYRPLNEYSVKVPRRLKHVIDKCMFHDREKRIPTVRMLLTQLGKIHHSFTSDSPEKVMKNFLKTPASKKVILSTRRIIPIRLIAALLLILITGATFFVVISKYFREWEKQTEDIKLSVDTHDKMEPVVTVTREIEKPQPSEERPAMKKIAPKGVSAPEKRRLSPEIRKTVSAQEKTEPPEPKKPKSLIEKLEDKYDTDNLVEIMAKELKGRDYKNVLKVYDNLSSEQAGSNKALIFKLRALTGLGNQSLLSSFIASRFIDDAEFHLAKARLAYSRRSITETKSALDKSLKSPREFMDYDKLKQEVYYYQALCETVEFDANPSEDKWKSAIGAWHQLKSEMRTNPNHRYYKKAETETKRIGEKYRISKG